MPDDAFDVLYLAVIPIYRQAFVDALEELLRKNSPILLTGDKNLDPTVTTGIDPSQYTSVTNHFLLGRRVMFQTGHLRLSIRAQTTVLDLNPRNLTVWSVALARKLLNRRTLFWGHLYPRRGAQSKSAVLRRLLRYLGDGAILYSYDEAPKAMAENPEQPVWVAPNSLYSVARLGAPSEPASRAEIIYVGRLVDSKKVQLLIEAYARSGLSKSRVRLRVVGDGPCRAELELLSLKLNCREFVTFTGSITDVATLQAFYGRAFCSVSPGYAGLSLTQSLGFGVPMVVADHESHAPEIELAAFNGVTFFPSDNVDALAKCLCEAYDDRELVNHHTIAAPVMRYYSAEAMAGGLADALNNRDRQTREVLWTTH